MTGIQTTSVLRFISRPRVPVWLQVAFLLLPTGMCIAAETPRMADSFVDAMGVMTEYAQVTPSGRNAATLKTKLGALGIRHIREYVTHSTPGSWLGQLYSEYGITTLRMSKTWTATPAEEVALMANPWFDAIEGKNEPENWPLTYNGKADNPGTNTFEGSLEWQRALYTAMKADARLSAKPVLSPPMGWTGLSQYLRPMQDHCDIVSGHPYPRAGWAPSIGWGTEVGGKTLDMQLGYIQEMLDSSYRRAQPFTNCWITETGYNYCVNANTMQWSITEKCGGKYIPRLFAEYFNRGVGRTYLYMFDDRTRDTINAFWGDVCGLTRFDYSERPAYWAVKNLIALLNDKGGPFTVTPLEYSLSGSTANVHHTLLQKRNGDYFLLLWQEINSTGSLWAKPPTDANNPEVSVTIGTAMRTATTYRDFTNPSGCSATSHGAASSLTVSVPDEIVVVRITPAATSVRSCAGQSHGGAALSRLRHGQFASCDIRGRTISASARAATPWGIYLRMDDPAGNAVILTVFRQTGR